MAEPFTFAVIGHDEAATLGAVLRQAQEAARAGDQVWFVDSASTDGSAGIAESLGIETVAAPPGKGRAVAVALAAALDRGRGGLVALVDADLEASEHDIPHLLRAAVDDGAAHDVDLLVGQFHEPARRRSVTPFLYRPLTAALFPEAALLGLRVPLSGFRVVRPEAVVGPLPPGYGVETHLNVSFAVARRGVARCELGWYRGPLRGYRNAGVIAADVSRAVLDLAELHDRLQPSMRPAWDEWAQDLVAVIADQPAVDAEADEYLDRLARLAARPLPSARSERSA
jgi:glycosyltransferase involved in cell wall biosynthesis